MSAIDGLLENNATYAQGFIDGGVPVAPALKVAVVTCMDARIDVHALLGLKPGDAHVMRNAGGIVTEDTLRSLMISQCLLGTREIMVIHHTGCGLQASEAELAAAIKEASGIRPAQLLGAFSDVEQDVRSSIGRIASSPMVPHKKQVRGFVYEVATGRLRPVA